MPKVKHWSTSTQRLLLEKTIWRGGMRPADRGEWKWSFLNHGLKKNANYLMKFWKHGLDHRKTNSYGVSLLEVIHKSWKFSEFWVEEQYSLFEQKAIEKIMEKSNQSSTATLCKKSL